MRKNTLTAVRVKESVASAGIRKLTPKMILSKADRIIEFQNSSLGWKELKNHLVLPLLPEQAHHPLEQISSGLKHFQGWSIHNISGQPVPAPHHCHSKEFLISSLNLSLFALKTLPLALSQPAHV